MKILLITEFFTKLDKPVFSGGVEARVFYTARLLAKKNKVIVICRRRTGELRQEKLANLQIIRLGKEIKDSHATIRSLWQRLCFVFSAFFMARKLNVDLVEGSNFVSMLPAFLIGWNKKIPKVVWYPDVLLASWRQYFGPILGLLGEAGERFFLKLPWDLVITISPSVAKKLKKYGVCRKNIKVIPCGVDLKIYRQRKKFALPTICVISRLLAYKKIDLAIDVYKALHKLVPDLQMFIVGTGPEKQKLKLKAKNFKIKFLNNLSLSKLSSLLSRSHLLLHPSLVEGFGIVLLEASASGTPFVAVNIPTSLALAKILGSGFIVEQNNAGKMAKKAALLLKNQAIYQRFCQSGIKKSAHYSWRKVTVMTEKVFLSFLK